MVLIFHSNFDYSCDRIGCRYEHFGCWSTLTIKLRPLVESLELNNECPSIFKADRSASSIEPKKANKNASLLLFSRSIFYGQMGEEGCLFIHYNIPLLSQVWTDRKMKILSGTEHYYKKSEKTINSPTSRRIHALFI